jgi:phosphoenolpyruvate-protein kinase (PTS system EI component)
LLRTEFLFFGRAEPPGEDEQTEALSQIAAALPPDASVTVRTLDIAATSRCLISRWNPKPTLSWGCGACVSRCGGANCSWSSCVRFCGPRTAGASASCSRWSRRWTNSAAPAPRWPQRTNNLTQYTLAVERGHPLLTGFDDALHPAVLRLIGLVAATARRHGKWAGVCGEAAADPLAAAVLLGLGVCELSVSAGSIARLRRTVGGLDLRQERPRARRALSRESAAEVRRFLTQPNSQL